MRTHAVAASRVELPPGVVEDGVILDQDKLAEAIRHAVDEAKPAPPKTKRVVAELPESRTLTHHVQVERTVKPRDLPERVLELAKDVLPINLDEYRWDYQVLGQNETTYEILVAAAPKDLVQTYEQTLMLAGLNLDALELESMALTRASIKSVKLPAGEATVVMDMGGRVTTFAFVDAEGLQLSATFPIAGDALTAAIASSLKIKPEDAEKQKRSKGFKDAAMAKAMQDALASLVEEFKKAQGFYEARHLHKVTSILLAGGSSAMPGIGEALTQSIGIPVELATIPFELPNMNPSQTVVVAGLALRATKLSPGLSFITGA